MDRGAYDMSKKDNYSEYTKLRDILVKRNKRAVMAGLAKPVHFPTVREIKAGVVSKYEAFSALKDYYSGGSQLKAIRQTGIVPGFREYPELPPKQKETPEESKQRKRDTQKRYRRRKAVREMGIDPEKQKKFESYLKALENVKNTWKESIKRLQGKPKARETVNLYRDLISALDNMTPSQAKAFVEYMDYRFSQGDFTQKYVIDEFVQGFSRLLSKGYQVQDITSDFEAFLIKRAEMGENAQNMQGLPSSKIMGLWDKFIGE